MLARATKYTPLSRTSLGHLRIYPKAYASTGKNGPPNQSIIDMLERSKTQESMQPEPNKYKLASFTRAVSVIRAYKRPITSPDDLPELKRHGIGVRIAARILAHISGESYDPEANISTKTPADKPQEISPEDIRDMQVLMTVPGIGRNKALKLLSEGCRSLQQLRETKFHGMLNTQQKLGIKYADEIAKPVLRGEAEAVEAFVREYLNSKWEVILVGSYRRGNPTSSDIDMILLHPSHVHIPIPNQKVQADKASSILHQDVIEPLRRTGIVSDTLTAGSLKWQGMVRVPQRTDAGKWESLQTRLDGVTSFDGSFKRADFTLVPLKSKGAATIALTGDVEFNKDLRKRASQLGMHLNESGLWRLHPRNDDASPKLAHDSATEEGYWELVASETEDDIFNELGMPWIDPEKRNFDYLIRTGSMKFQPRTGKRGRGRPPKI